MWLRACDTRSAARSPAPAPPPCAAGAAASTVATATIMRLAAGAAADHGSAPVPPRVNRRVTVFPGAIEIENRRAWPS